jgi:hemoglobin-like flavoprotein
MGGGSSCIGRRSNGNRTLINGLTLSNAQIDLLTATWDMIEIDADKVQHVGDLAFSELFEKVPDSFDLFAKFKDDSEWRSSKSYKHHCKIAVKVIGRTLKMLSKDEYVLMHTMEYMGSRHSAMHIPEPYFDIFGHAFIDAVGVCLGPTIFTAEAREAWTTLYTVVATMLQKYKREIDTHLGHQHDSAKALIIDLDREYATGVEKKRYPF